MNMTIVDNTNLVMKLPIIGQEFVILKNRKQKDR